MMENKLLNHKNNKIYYGYIIASAAFFIQILGPGSYITYGIFFNSFLTEFGWSRAVISGASSLYFFMFGLLGILTGRLVDKIGPRIVMTGCGIFYGSGYMLMSQIQSVWQLYLFYGLIVAIGFSAIDVVTLSTIARWFSRRRGTMTGTIKVGAGVGLLIGPLAINWLILSYGWRTSYIIMGGVVLVFLLAASQFLKRDPSRIGLLPDGEKRINIGKVDPEEAGFPLQKAVQTKQFWMLCVMCLFFGFCLQTVMIHSAPYAIDIGASPSTAASILSIIGGVSIAGRFIMGGASDKIGNKWGYIICFGCFTIAFITILTIHELGVLYLFAVVYGFGHGGLWVLLSPVLAALFGIASHGTIFGLVYFVITIGGTIGPILAGYLFDITGSYQAVFSTCLIFSIIGIILSSSLTPTAYSKAKRI
jgi:MFS family permease